MNHFYIECTTNLEAPIECLFDLFETLVNFPHPICHPFVNQLCCAIFFSLPSYIDSIFQISRIHLPFTWSTLFPYDWVASIKWKNIWNILHSGRKWQSILFEQIHSKRNDSRCMIFFCYNISIFILINFDPWFIWMCFGMPAVAQYTQFNLITVCLSFLQ